MDYLDFEVEVSPGSSGSYTVSVIRSPAGEAVGTMRLPFDQLALENRLQALQIALLRSGATRRRVESPDDRTVSEFGRQLYEALFSGQILARLEVSREEARERNQGLRLKLRFTAPELAVLPWEYLFDPARGDFLSLSVSTPLVRYIPLPQAMEPLEVTGPLRILGLVVSPTDMPELDAGRERQRLEIAIEQLRSRGAVELEWLPGQTWRYLQAALRRGPWHIFHFVGHGGFDDATGEGFIMLADDQGRGQRLTATDLGRLLGDHEPLRLAVLNACEGARGSQMDLFSSTSAVLVRHGTPAVVAMQYEITDTAAIEFSRSFYDAVADGMPVDTSLAEARKGLSMAIPNTFEWGTPVLHMRAPDGVLFRVAAEERDRAAGPSRREPTDVFFSFDRADAPQVGALAASIRETASIEPILERATAGPGGRPDDALERAVDASRAVVLFLGPANRSTWEREPLRTVLERRAHDPGFRIVPVLLPGASLPDLGRLPRFLAQVAWVDLRAGIDDTDAVAQLVQGLEGEAGPAEEMAATSEDVDAAPPPPVPSDICPFRGLEAFDEDHAEFFFGREALTQQLVERLREDRFLAVVGPSGSGKSSVVRAGLIPALRGGALDSSASWPIVVLRPGVHPLESLAARLVPQVGGKDNPLAVRDSILSSLVAGDRGLNAVTETAFAAAPDDRRLVIVVDQFEEVFTLCRDDEERRRFVSTLLHASSVPGGQTIVVLTMRADFFGKSAAIPELAARIGDRVVLVPPMEAPELRRAMIQPAERVGLRFEKGLVDTIVAEMGREPGILPLLQHMLLELWEGRRGGWLTMERYREIGGVRGAIAQRAETVYSSLTPEQQGVARRVLLRLTQPGQGTETTRRRASMAELIPPGSEAGDVEEVVRRLIDARLITSSQDASGDVLDVAHEALIKGWPRLQSWVEENPAALRIHRRLTDTAAEWNAGGRDPSYLYRGGRLQETVAWAERNPADQNEVERDFLVASVAARDADERGRQRRARRLIAGLAAVAAIFAVLGGVAFVSARTADSQRAVAKNAETAAQARYLLSEGLRVGDSDPLLALRLGVESLAVAREVVPPLDLTAEVRALATRGRIRLLGEDIDSVVTSRDGALVVLDRRKAPGELRRTVDGGLVMALSGEVDSAEFLPEPEAEDAPPSAVAAIPAGPVFGAGIAALATAATPSVEPPQTLLLVTYKDESQELRHADGTLIPMPDVSTGAEAPKAKLVAISFGSIGVGVFIAWYDGAPGEVRRVSDGSLIRKLPEAVTEATFHSSPGGGFWTVNLESGGVIVIGADGSDVRPLDAPPIEVYRSEGQPNLLVCYEEAAGEIWSGTDLSLIETLPEGCGYDADVVFPSDDREVFEISKSDENGRALSPAIYRLDTGTLVRRVPETPDGEVEILDVDSGLIRVQGDDGIEIRADWGRVSIGKFSNESTVWAIPAGDAFVVDTGAGGGDLRSTVDGSQIHHFTRPIEDVQFSPDGMLFAVKVPGGGELWRVAGGTPELVSPDIVDAWVSPDATVYLATMKDNRTLVRQLASDSVMATLEGEIAELYLSPDWLLADLAAARVAIRLSDGLRVDLPAGASLDVTFDDDVVWPHLLFPRDDQRTSVWGLGESFEVFRSGLGESVSGVDPSGKVLVTLGTDGRAYVVDLAWVRQIGGVGSTLNADALIKSACSGPLAGGGWDQAAFAKALGDRPPIACQP